MSGPEKKENPHEPLVPKEWNELVDKLEAEGLEGPTVIGRPDRLADERERATQQSSAPFYASAEEQAEYLARVYQGDRPFDALPYEVVYGFGCHQCNEISVVEELWSMEFQFVLIPGRDKYILEGGIVAYSGKSMWRKWIGDNLFFERYNRPDDVILSVPATLSGGQNSNTLLEAIDLINFVKMRGWNSLAIVAFPAHLPRAFASAVTAARHLGWNGKIYAHCGAPLRWDERVTHSHGTGAITRAQAVREEQKRLDAYCVSGSPVPLLRARALLDYLNQRDLGDQLESKSQNLGQ